LNSSLIWVNETPINIRTEYMTTNKDIYAHSYLISCWKIDRQKLQEAPCNIPEFWMIYHVWIFAKI
jgi:hypothetical protein